MGQKELDFSKQDYATIHNRYGNPNQTHTDASGNCNGSGRATLFVKTLSRCQHTDWELCEQIRIQELNETRERALQMENTMRWWSQCTASWRQKWSIVRHERNEARDELTRTRDALHEIKKEMQHLSEAKERSDEELNALNIKVRENQLHNQLAPILIDVSASLKSPTASKLTPKLRRQNVVEDVGEQLAAAANGIATNDDILSVDFVERKSKSGAAVDGPPPPVIIRDDGSKTAQITGEVTVLSGNKTERIDRKPPAADQPADDLLRIRIEQLELERITALETIAQLRVENAKLAEQLMTAAATASATADSSALTNTLFVGFAASSSASSCSSLPVFSSSSSSSASSSSGSAASASFVSAKSTFNAHAGGGVGQQHDSEKLTVATAVVSAFTTSGETPPQPLTYQYGGGNVVAKSASLSRRARRRNSLC